MKPAFCLFYGQAGCATTRRRQLATHDECAFNANDSSSYSWKTGTEWLNPKSRGKGLKVSEFMCASQGRLRYLDQETREKASTTEIIKYGSGKYDDGWWGAEKMAGKTQKAIRIFETSPPGDIAVFALLSPTG